MTFDGLNPPYSTIVIDPPWDYGDGFVNGPARGSGWSNRKPLPYSSMAVGDMARLPISDLINPEDGAFLFLWTTSRYLISAFSLLTSWGFTYRQILVWWKGDASPFPAAVAPNSAEFLLVAKRGGVKRKGTIPSSVIATVRQQHSVKPGVFGDLIEEISPGPYVELFARQPRLGWDHWGHGYESEVAS